MYIKDPREDRCATGLQGVFYKEKLVWNFWYPWPQLIFTTTWLPGIFKYYCSEQLLHSQFQDTNKLQPPQSSPSDTYIVNGQTLTWVGDIQQTLSLSSQLHWSFNVSHCFLCLSLPCPPLSTVSFTSDTSILYAPLPTTDHLTPDIPAPPREPERLVLSNFLHPPKDVLLTISFTV